MHSLSSLTEFGASSESAPILAPAGVFSDCKPPQTNQGQVGTSRTLAPGADKSVFSRDSL